MRSVHNIKRVVTALVLLSLTAFSAQAVSKDGNNWKPYPPIKKEQKQPVQVTEPATFALFGLGVGALGLRAFLRRRKH